MKKILVILSLISPLFCFSQTTGGAGNCNDINYCGGLIVDSSITTTAIIADTATVDTINVSGGATFGDNIVIDNAKRLALDGSATGTYYFRANTADLYMEMAANGSAYRYYSGEFHYANSLSWNLRNEISSSTNPLFIPMRGNTDNGFGGAANELSMIINAKETFTSRAGECEVVGDLIVTEAHFDNTRTYTGASDSILTTDYFINATYTATDSVLFMIPTAQIIDGRVLVFKDGGFNAGTKGIRIYCENGALIDDNINLIIAGDKNSINLICDGTNWLVWQ